MPADILIVLGVLLLFWGTYMAWEKEYNDKTSLQLQVDSLNKPILKFEFRSIVMYEFTEYNNGSGVVLWFRVDNLGSTASIPEDAWLIKAFNNEKEYDGFLRIQKEEKLPLVDREGAKIGLFEFHSGDALYLRLHDPLQRASSKIGILPVTFRTMPFDILNNDATIISICCKDVYGNEWKFRESIGDMSNKHYGFESHITLESHKLW